MANYSNLYNYIRCSGCAMHTGSCRCSAVCEDGFMLNCDTCEVIDTAIPVFDYEAGAVPMCERCAWVVAEECDDDGEYHADYIQTEDTNRYYSREYAENYLYQCDDCGNWFEYSDGVTYFDGGYYCRECKPNHGVIMLYHEHHGDFTPIGGDWSDDLIGLEIESDYYDGTQEETAAALDEHFNRGAGYVLAFEDDCSLSEGFETITQPHTLQALREFDFETLCDIMMNGGACSNPSTAGLHMHFSRSWFGDTRDEQHATAGRLMRAYSDNWDVLVGLSCRGDIYSIDSYAQPPTIYDECDDLDLYAENCGGWGDRYHAINCENRDTIEFRLGAGYLDAGYIRAWIELHVQMVRAARAGQAFRVNHDYTITILSDSLQAA